MSENIQTLTPTVAIVGGGPAGLSAAKNLARANIGEILVLEREQQAGGIPRHSDHLGYGIRDRKRFMSGPAYARLLVAEAERAGAQIMTQTMVTGWSDARTLIATSPQGRIRIHPEVVLFATGARERPRTAQLIVGDRPAGILTTGQLQNLVHLKGEKVGSKAVIVNAELVSWSAALTLKQSGSKVAALVTTYPRSESYGLFRLAGRLLLRTPVVANSRVVRILGRRRVAGLEIENLVNGKRDVIECDTVVFSGNWIADNELLRMADVELSPSSGPAVDEALRTPKNGVFAAGNLIHPVETADVVALEGEYAASRILEHLQGRGPQARPIAIEVAEPLRWVSPSAYSPDGPLPSRNRLITWVDDFIRWPVVTVTQDGRLIKRKRILWPAAPGRAFRIPASVLKGVDKSGGTITVSVG